MSKIPKKPIDLKITPLVKGKVSPPRAVPPFIKVPNYAKSGVPAPTRRGGLVCSPDVISRMRSTCQAAARILRLVGEAVKEGITTDELDAIAHDAYLAEGGYPSPLNYHHFPKSICTSINEVICHGIPDSTRLADGDIVNIDVTIYKDGVHGDTNATFLVGEVHPRVKELVDVAKRSLESAISVVKPGARVRDLGKAIERIVKPSGFSIVESYCGHGIGEDFHNALFIPHYYDHSARTILKPGMIFTIEPMINMGSKKDEIWDDNWTAVTVDGLPSAQFEHTLLVTQDGVEILTQ
jgi:methionyl aminopeptidase